MSWILYSSFGAFVLLSAATFAPTPLMLVLQATAAAMLIAGWRRTPSLVRRQILQTFRVELWVLSAMILALAALGITSWLTHGTPASLVWLWAILSYGFLAMLVVRIIRMVSRGVRQARQRVS